MKINGRTATERIMDVIDAHPERWWRPSAVAATAICSTEFAYSTMRKAVQAGTMERVATPEGFVYRRGAEAEEETA